MKTSLGARRRHCDKKNYRNRFALRPRSSCVRHPECPRIKACRYRPTPTPQLAGGGGKITLLWKDDLTHLVAKILVPETRNGDVWLCG
jgi:hypothetical protein